MGVTSGVDELEQAFASNAILQAIQQQRMGLDAAARFAKEMGLRPAVVDVALARLREQCEQNRVIRPAVVDKDRPAPWYLGPMSGGHWERYESLLRSKGAVGLDALGQETTQIVSLLANPASRGDRRKGLVMGNVQSGKTRNFGGVVAKSVDAGYRFVIVLSGMHNNLREQTQTRLDAQLFDGPDWYPLTDAQADIGQPRRPDQLFLRQSLLCAVVKKNVTRLDNLIRMMRDVPESTRRNVPVLIVDDEADQATPNSLAEREEVSAINQRLRDLWATVLTGSYLAYTATPFANVLMDPDDEADLFPSDFITTIEPGEGYFGPERVFGITETVDGEDEVAEGLDMVRLIPGVDSAALRPPSSAEERARFAPVLPGSLEESLAWFVVATAIRRSRGQVDHSSMLVHTTHYTAPHFALQSRIRARIVELLLETEHGDVTSFRESWVREASRATSEATVPMPNWERVADFIPAVLADLEVIVDNGDSSDRLDYKDDRPRTVVAVGGGTLSRGLTLEGLVVSYFTRTSNTYDTLMQMGRWFGYRPGYEDLPRVWVASGLDRDYAFLARVEKELRDEIAAVASSEFTPRQVGVRVRAHPGRLAVTAANKMYCAHVVQLGLSGTSNQTFLLDGSPEVIKRNFASTEDLIGDLELSEVPWNPARRAVSGVRGQQVIRFLQTFQVHPEQGWLSGTENQERITEWISQWALGPVWNVVLAGNSRSVAKDGVTELGTVRLGGQELHCLDRAPQRGSTPDKIDLKAIMSADDRLSDIAPGRFAALPHGNNAQRRRVRRLTGEGRGLIVIYPLSAHSKASSDPAQESRTRIDMPVREHQLGFSIFFPHVNDEHGQDGTYVSVRRDWEVSESFDDELPKDTEEDHEA